MCELIHNFSQVADMPSFMSGNRIVGGAVAPSMIPWQVAMLSGSFQFCGGTVLDACTVLSAAHCEITTSNTIRAGSLDKTTGGQVRLNCKALRTLINQVTIFQNRREPEIK